MNKKNYSLLLILLLIMSACGEKSTSKVVQIGRTTLSELKNLLGEPKRIDTFKTPALASSQIVVYDENQKYQVEDNKVVASFRAPFEQEKSLLYWKHRCRNERTTFRSLKRKVDNHLKAEQEFSCKQSRLTVIYDPNIDRVVRVINYGVEDVQ